MTPERRIFGVAPESKWMGCRNMDHGLGSIQTFLECLQFYLAPTDVKGENPNPLLRPHIVTNSYSCGIGVCKEELFNPVIKALVESGVALTAAAGNSQYCSNINGIVESSPEIITVGATRRNSEEITNFSSLGPVKRNNMRKPDVTAPGEKIFSAIQCCAMYAEMSGTSMAAPQISGAIALLWSGIPKLRRKIKLTWKILEKTALHQESIWCKSESKTPNNVYGYGTVNVLKALEYGRQLVQNNE
eukprot:gene2266-2440_t